MKLIRVVMKSSVNNCIQNNVLYVKRGYAVNYLIKYNFAEYCNEETLDNLKKEQENIIQKHILEKESQEIIKKKIDDQFFNFIERVSESGQFYRFINSKLIVEEVNKILDDGEKIDSKQISFLNIDKIKEPGIFEINIRLKQGVTSRCFVNVNLSENLLKVAEKNWKKANIESRIE